MLAVMDGCAEVREWDSNGTVFGFNPSIPGHDAGGNFDMRHYHFFIFL
jgi:hypothetical protein